MVLDFKGIKVMKSFMADGIMRGAKGGFSLVLSLAISLGFGLSLAGCGTMAKMSLVPEQEKQAFMTAKIDKVLERRLDDAKPGMAILIVKDGNVIYNRSKGLADSAKKFPLLKIRHLNWPQSPNP